MKRAWKRQLVEDGPSVFASKGERKQREQEAQEAELYEQMAAARPLRIGQPKMELEWLKKIARFGASPVDLAGAPDPGLAPRYIRALPPPCERSAANASTSPRAQAG